MSTFRLSKKDKARLVSLWTDEHTHVALLPEMLQKIAEDVNSPKSLAMSLALKYDDHDALLDLCDVPPSFYGGSKEYYLDNLVSSLVKKYPHWKTSYQTEKEAQMAFISAEMQCLETNQRLSLARRSYRRDEVPSIMLMAARNIAEILGSCPKISELPFEFGPGATFSVRGRTSAYDKISGALDVTPKAVDSAVELLVATPGWLSLHGLTPRDRDRIRDCLTFTRGDRLSFVPKTAKTDRPIAIGPTLNVLLQKGYGAVIRSRLKQSGLHLNRAPDRHRALAAKASVTGSLATIDLKSASDTVSYGIVESLLPCEWFDALDDVRSPEYTIEDKWYFYHKFSAMGNGYTFELESLIFYALAKACAKYLGLSTRDVSVFGDDIIIPTEAAQLLMQVLSFSGFTVNEEKSFWDGPFRESCGGDFFAGIAVRGFYLKDGFRLMDIVRFRNYLYRTGYRFWLAKTWRWLRKQLKPYESYLAGPDDLTDDHIVFDEFDHSKPFQCITVQKTERRLPRRWHHRRVFMLYNSMKITPFDPMSPNLSNKAPTVASDEYTVGISSRFIRTNHFRELLPWEAPHFEVS